ncbi:hypothetical protein J4E81_000487 [Alternaria sp. BMP 2799]|nr:hypothetical protein J4E81_000487 [Alternaria sp. BMP 2799]
MSTSPALYTRTAVQVLELLKANTITVEAYAQSLLDRIRDRDDVVKAWAHLDMPTQYGSPIYEGHQSGFDSSAFAILRAAGALIFGLLPLDINQTSLDNFHRQDNDN